MCNFCATSGNKQHCKNNDFNHSPVCLNEVKGWNASVHWLNRFCVETEQIECLAANLQPAWHDTLILEGGNSFYVASPNIQAIRISPQVFTIQQMGLRHDTFIFKVSRLEMPSGSLYNCLMRCMYHTDPEHLHIYFNISDCFVLQKLHISSSSKKNVAVWSGMKL